VCEPRKQKSGGKKRGCAQRAHALILCFKKATKGQRKSSGGLAPVVAFGRLGGMGGVIIQGNVKGV